MSTNKDLEHMLEDAMSVESSDIKSPGLSLVYQARQKVQARKKIAKEQTGFLFNLVAFFKLDLKFYHLGLSLLIVSAGIFYVNEPDYGKNEISGLTNYNEALSVQSNTVSVNSSTMLTSIPTLVIRN